MKCAAGDRAGVRLTLSVMTFVCYCPIECAVFDRAAVVVHSAMECAVFDRAGVGVVNEPAVVVHSVAECAALDFAVIIDHSAGELTVSDRGIPIKVNRTMEGAAGNRDFLVSPVIISSIQCTAVRIGCAVADRHISTDREGSTGSNAAAFIPFISTALYCMAVPDRGTAGQRGGVSIVDTAAIGVTNRRSRQAAHDIAAGHGKAAAGCVNCTAGHIHAAALSRCAAHDAATGHMKCAVLPDIHAAGGVADVHV